MPVVAVLQEMLDVCPRKATWGAAQKVLTSHGLDYYFTGIGAEFNYIGALITIALALVAVVVGWAINWWQNDK